MILQAKFHVVLSLLKSGAFIVIMLLNKSLTQVRSQKGPMLNFTKSFTLTLWTLLRPIVVVVVLLHGVPGYFLLAA